MQSSASWDRARSESHRHTEDMIEISPAALCRRLLVHALSDANETSETSTNHQSELDHRALALVGVTLRPHDTSNLPPQQQRYNLPIRSASHQSSLLLTGLPMELLLMFLDYLDWESLTTLRLANKFFAELVMSANLQSHYQRCLNETAWTEERVVKEGSGKFMSRWPIGAVYGQHQRAQALVGDMDRLPCYRCLRWFRCPPVQFRNIKESRKSVFSDFMGHAQDRDGVYRYITRSRLCFNCGVKSGYYPKGGQFKRFIICVNCGRLGKDLLIPGVQPETSIGTEGGGGGLRFQYYCRACVVSGACASSREQYAHEYGKEFRYEKAMWQKREACKAKRKQLGRERADESNRWEVWCPILERKSICSCWRDEDRWRSYFSEHTW